MRSPRLPGSLIAGIFRTPLAQAVAERDAFVEDKAFAAPAALALRHGFQIFQDAALEMIDFGKTARQKVRTGLLAADTAGAEHRDLPVLRRLERARGEILELAETF